jgi:hypothetical protein
MRDFRLTRAYIFQSCDAVLVTFQVVVPFSAQRIIFRPNHTSAKDP